MTLNGVRIIESVWLTEPGNPVEVQRTWRQRLFSRPWRPWKATFTMIPHVPMRGGYQMGDAIVMHPETVRKLKSATEGKP